VDVVAEFASVELVKQDVDVVAELCII
jgi:hypothetical protein